MAGPAISLIDQSVGVTQAPRLAVYRLSSTARFVAYGRLRDPKGKSVAHRDHGRVAPKRRKRLESAWLST